MKRLVLILGIVSLAGALLNTNALAATACTGTISGGTINGGLTIGPGVNCLLDGVTVNGGIKMTGGELEACDSTINGGIQAKNASCIVLGVGEVDTGGGEAPTAPCDTGGDTITGGIQIQDITTSGTFCAGAVANFESENSTISGGVQIKNIPTAELEDAHVTGGVQLNNNGAVEVTGSTITGGLQCAHNTGPNTVMNNNVTGGGTCD